MVQQIHTVEKKQSAYPPLLREISDPPDQLFVRGNLSVLRNPYLLAVVGSRRANHYGQQAIAKLLPPVIRAGCVIVSGLAFGIDALAHQACVENNGPTIAVLGGGVDDATISPRTNLRLAQKILQGGGAIVSEYPPGSPPHKGSFPERNRIIAGLCRVVLIVQANQQSGSLITARLALEYNRDVTAVPGPITDPLSVGTNQLIQYGATPILSADDLFQILAIEKAAATQAASQTISSEQAIVLKKLSHQPKHIDEVTATSNLPAPQVAVLLTELELLEHVQHVGGMKYVKRN